MPYSTTPITSGSAKFSTLDPDADLFLEENDITVGANPENPATLYDYDTSTLNISHIVGNNGEVDLSDSDLIGVNQFVCKDYLGAVLAEASDVPQWNLILNDVRNTNSKKFRVPSNFVDSTINLKFYGSNTDSSQRGVSLYKYNDDGTTTLIKTALIPAGTSTPTEQKISDVPIKAGEVYLFKSSNYYCIFHGSQGVTICCNLSSVTGGYWVISN